MLPILYLIPILTAIIAALSSILTVALLFRSYQSSAVADKLMEAFSFKIQEMDLESDLDELLEKHLIEFIGTLKQQIPMASMFLSGALSDRLKNLAKQEFIKMLPELKDKIWVRFSSNFSFIEEMIRESIYKKMRKIVALLAILGFLVGGLAVLFF